MTTCIAFTASKRPEAQEALQRLTQKYGQYDEDKADVIVALGGDGAMLDAMRRRFEDQLLAGLLEEPLRLGIVSQFLGDVFVRECVMLRLSRQTFREHTRFPSVAAASRFAIRGLFF